MQSIKSLRINIFYVLTKDLDVDIESNFGSVHKGDIKHSNADITKIILEIFSKADFELRAMGANGRRLVEEKYEQHKVATMMKQLYEWIVEDKSMKPEYVF